MILFHGKGKLQETGISASESGRVVHGRFHTRWDADEWAPKPKIFPTLQHKFADPCSRSYCTEINHQFIEAAKGGFYLGQNQRTRPKKVGGGGGGRGRGRGVPSPKAAGEAPRVRPRGCGPVGAAPWAGASLLGRVLLTQRGTRWQERSGRKALGETSAGRSRSFAVEVTTGLRGERKNLKVKTRSRERGKTRLEDSGGFPGSGVERGLDRAMEAEEPDAEMSPSVDGTGDTRRNWIMPSAVGRWTGDQGRVRKCRFI
nr:uncharacterized protein LOC112934946 [Vulpes vulpes]